MRKKTVNLLAIVGPTASGKTHLAVLCALQRKGEIVSADSRQIYRGMDIGTGKDLEEYRTSHGLVPYHLIDVAEPTEVYTLYHYQQACYAVIQDVWHRSRLPILAGGTGLYIEAVLKHYRVPNVPENPGLRRSLHRRGKVDLIDLLKTRDNKLYAATDLSSKKRIIRALEIADYAQHYTIEWGAAHPPPIRPLIIGVRWPRQVLLERIDNRLKQRLENGMVNEVKKLLASGIEAERFDYFGMEYRHVARYLADVVSYEKMIQELAMDIHRLAKRQMTYFRGMARRGLLVHWIEGADSAEADKILKQYAFE